MQMDLDMSDLAKLEKTLRTAQRYYPMHYAAALYQMGLLTISQSVRVVPVDTGRLKNAIYVDPPKRRGGEWSVYIGAATDYALMVHEDTSTWRPYGGNAAGSNSPGQSKYIEHPLRERESTWKRDILKLVNRNIRKGISNVQIPTTRVNPGESS